MGLVLLLTTRNGLMQRPESGESVNSVGKEVIYQLVSRDEAMFK